jgi:hypothetical protein
MTVRKLEYKVTEKERLDEFILVLRSKFDKRQVVYILDMIHRDT